MKIQQEGAQDFWDCVAHSKGLIQVLLGDGAPLNAGHSHSSSPLFVVGLHREDWGASKVPLSCCCEQVRVPEIDFILLTFLAKLSGGRNSIARLTSPAVAKVVTVHTTLLIFVAMFSDLIRLNLIRVRTIPLLTNPLPTSRPAKVYANSVL